MSLLPGLTQSAPGVPLFAPASGGGGGGGSANPQVSTITFPPAVPTPGGPTSGAILFSEQLLIDDLATAIAGDFALTAAAPYPNGLAGPTSTTSLTIFAPQNGCSLSLGCGEDEVIYIDGAAGGGDPGVAVRGVGNVSISSMTISSINGAVPGGGGGGPNPVFSTITLNETGGVGIPNINFAGDNAVIACANAIQFTDSPYTNSEIDLAPQNPPVMTMFNDSNVQAMIIGTTADGYGYIGQSGPGAQGIQLANISSINGAAPGGGAFNPNPQFSTLACIGSATMSGGINMSNTTLQLSQFTSNGAVAYYNAGDSNIYITAPSTATVRLGAQDGTSALQVSGTGVNIPGLLTASNAFISSLSSSEIVTPNLQTAGNQVTIQQSNSLGATAVFGWPNATQVNLGMIAANASDGMSFVCDNGGVYISGGGGHFSLSNVSSINGSAPALTSYTQQDVGALFSTLFAANPSLSTITF